MLETNEDLKMWIKRKEGFSKYAYKCTLGYLTWGYGHNLERERRLTEAEKNEYRKKQITEEEAEVLLENDIKKCREYAENIFADYKLSRLNSTRENVIVAMVYQLGNTGTRNFKRFIHALFMGDYNLAMREMIDSKWRTQTESRCVELALILAKG